MDEEKALKLTKSNEIYRAAIEAETRNCDLSIVRQLWKNYLTATEREEANRRSK